MRGPTRESKQGEAGATFPELRASVCNLGKGLASRCRCSSGETLDLLPFTLTLPAFSLSLSSTFVLIG